MAALTLLLSLAVMAPPAASEPVAGLPYALGRSFTTLDEYLAFLERQRHIGMPYYRRIGPNLYERQLSSRTMREERVVRSRDDLEKEFGFTRRAKGRDRDPGHLAGASHDRARHDEAGALAPAPEFLTRKRLAAT